MPIYLFKRLQIFIKATHILREALDRVSDHFPPRDASNEHLNLFLLGKSEKSCTVLYFTEITKFG